MVEMIPAHCEYWAAVALLAVIALAVAGGPTGLRRLVRRRSYGISLVAFVAFCTAMDIAGVAFAWWRWPDDHIAGWRLWSIPLEEFGVMLFAHLLIVALWENGANAEHCRSRKASLP